MPTNSIAAIKVDAVGRILGVNALAAEWWAVSRADELNGLFLAELFIIDILGDHPASQLELWQELRKSSPTAPLSLTAIPLDGEEFSVELSMTREEQGYIAILKKPLRPIGINNPEDTSKESGPSESTGKPQPDAPPESPAETPAATGTTGLPEMADLAFFEVDLARGQHHFSELWKTMLGFTANELANSLDTLTRLVHPDDSEAAPHHPVEGTPGEKRPYSTELRMRRRDGNFQWVQSVGTKYFDNGGKLARVVGLHLDIHERKLVEEAALVHEERFLTLLRQGELAFFDLDFRHAEAYFSPAWNRLLGHESGNADANPSAFRKFLDFADKGHSDLESLFADPEQRSVVCRAMNFRHHDGTRLRLPIRLSRITNRRGELWRVQGMVIEVDSWPDSEENQQIPPLIAVKALDYLQEGVIVADPDSKVLLVNGVAQKLTGRRWEDGDHPLLNDLLRLTYRHNGKPANDWSEGILASGTPVILSKIFNLVDSRGATREILLSCHPLRGSDQTIVGSATIFRDPNDLSLTPEELVQSNRQEALSLLAGGIAHDFNHLLTRVIGGIAHARETHSTDILENAERACQDAVNLGNQLQTFSQGQISGKQVVEIDHIVRDTLRLATAGTPVRPELDWELDDPHLVEVDYTRIQQVFSNLIINSIQAMGTPGGKLRAVIRNIRLSEGERTGLPEGDYVKVAIEDSGPGIAPEDLERVFEPFFTTKKSGTGLGLSTVNMVVQEHQGLITVASQLGQGAVFSVYLPKTAKKLEDPTRRSPELKFGTGHILFMDADEELRNLAARILKRLDYECDLAKSGDEAVSLYRRYLNLNRPYDAVILDLTVPGGMGGEETLRQLRELNPEVRAVISTGYHSDETTHRFLTNGFAGILPKPYSSAEMGKVLRRVLGRA